MVVRILGDDEKNRIRPLYEEVFDDSQEFLDYYFDSYIGDTINFVSELNGEIVGMATIHPKEIVVSEEKVRAGYVYAVATAPKHRGKGIMRSILEEIYSYAYDKHYAYLYLIPANPKIYEGLGYELLRHKSELIMGDNVTDDKNMHNIEVTKFGESQIHQCLEFVSKYYENRVSLYYTEDVLREYFKRLSINNSGIYCIFHRICDRILGLAFLEDDGGVNIFHLICDEENEKMCMNSIKSKLNVDKITKKTHDIMFKAVHKDIDSLKKYPICINDEV